MTKTTTITSAGTTRSKTIDNRDIILTESILEGGMIFRNCSISNVNATINNCVFEGCKIDCAGLTNCTLVDCTVFAYDAGITNCKIENPDTISVTRCAMTGCSLSNVSCNIEGVVFLEDSKIIDCTFTDVDLHNDSYLIMGIDDCSVSNCQFKHCYTERDDLQIIYCETTIGKLFKRRKEHNIVAPNCEGLDAVKRYDAT